MKKYLYVGPIDLAPLMVLAKRRPSEKTIPRSGTWVVREWHDKEWLMPCFPEITWGTLKKMLFVGQIKQ